MPADGYDPGKSQVGDDKLADFLRAPITGELQEIPGVGKGAVTAFNEAKIFNTFQLIGQFLLLKGVTEEGELLEAKEHCDKFWYWLKDTGINSYRSGIVMAIAEKVNTMMPGLYDASEF